MLSTSSSELSDHENATPQLVDLISSSPPRATSTHSPNAARFKQTTLSTTPTKAHARTATANHPPNVAPIYLPPRNSNRIAVAANTNRPSASPEKAKASRISHPSEKGKSKDIHTFFSTQLPRQRTTVPERTSSQSAVTPRIASSEDGISDDDDEILDAKATATSFVGAVAKKRARGSTAGNIEVTSGSQKFIRKPLPGADAMKMDTRPWAERFAPVNLDELAVHKKKVTDVRGWLDAVIKGQLRQRMLVLKGAAGTGKTTTVQLLAQAMDFQVLEWRNPVGSVASSDGLLSMAAQFEEFMGRGGKFGQLDITDERSSTPAKADMKPLDRRKSIILVEEFPNTFMRSSAGLDSFRSAILHYLAANTPPLSSMYSQKVPTDDVNPLILVVSETLLTTTSASADSFTAHRLLGPEILHHPGVNVIEFNAIAPTLLAKALDLIVLKESRKSGRRKTPGPLVLKRLGEIGDVRSAIGSLEFLCIRGDETGDWGSKVTFTKGKKVSKATPLTKMEQDSLELVSRREATLGIFHAVGKVVYNKRDELPRNDDVEVLPEFMEDRARPRRSQVMIEELIDETGTDTQTFIAALHENYILSCDAAPSDMNSFSDLHHVNGCLDALSDSDLLCPLWDGSFNSAGFGGAIGGRGSGGDVLRQDELCFQIAVRGILFSLPYPVRRRAPATTSHAGARPGPGGDAFKMFYPTSLKLWRAQEEIQSSIDLWVTKLLKGANPLAASHAVPSRAEAPLATHRPDSVESWSHRRTILAHDLGSQHRRAQDHASKTGDDNDVASPLLLSRLSARREMLLERLPYMVVITKAHKARGSSGVTSEVIRAMEKLTRFVGINRPLGEEDEEADADAAAPTMLAAEEWATDRPGDADEEHGRGRRSAANTMRDRLDRSLPASAAGLPPSMGLESRFAAQKLVISDDDIEDSD